MTDKKIGATQAIGKMDRRKFLQTTAVGSIAGLGVTTTSFAVTDSRSNIKWDREADIVVVGSGAAASVSAIAAAHAKNLVIIVEKAPIYGGTTAKSEGAFWIPNHRFLREQGIEDPRDDAIRYMARCAYVQLYRPGEHLLGLPKLEYNLLAAFYDNAAPAVEFLEKVGALKYIHYLRAYDYIDSAKENKVPRDRMLNSERPDGSPGRGKELIRQLRAWIDANNIPVLLNHRVQTVLSNEQQKVIGVKATTSDGTTVHLRARKAVVFGSGGYTHNAELIRNFQPGPIAGGCATSSCEGDFIAIGESVGAKLGNMASAWRDQIVLEQALETPSVPQGVWQPPGDSMVLVNKYGKRVVGEKRNYNERSKVHFQWDPNKSEFINQYLFMIYDRRTAELFAGNYPLPAPGETLPYVISAQTLDDLGQAIQQRLEKYESRLGVVRLDKGFAKNLHETVSKFDKYASSGLDEEFQRGIGPYDADWHSVYFSIPRKDTTWKTGTMPTIVMHPFQPQGPYYAIIFAAGTLDTNGGPIINEHGQVLDSNNQPIAGLYGAGNCIASPGGGSYFGGGATIGLAMTFGYLAGSHATGSAI